MMSKSKSSPSGGRDASYPWLTSAAEPGTHEPAAHQKTRLPRPRSSRQTGLFARNCLICEWGGHAEASARRLLLRVTTPLASTAIIHCSPPFNLWFDDFRPGANQNGPVIVRKGSFATRHREPTTPLFLPSQAPARQECRCRRTTTKNRRFGFARSATYGCSHGFWPKGGVFRLALASRDPRPD